VSTHLEDSSRNLCASMRNVCGLLNLLGGRGRGRGRSSTDGFARTSLVDVSLVEEAGEQHKVRKVHQQRQFDVGFAHVALLTVLLQLISPQVDSTSDHHLDELCRRDDHRNELGHSIAHGFQGIVRVHGRVHHVIHRDEPTGRCRVFREGVPRVDEDGGVVVPMQEDERLFAQNDEDGVAQFWNFGQDEHGGPESRHFVLDDEAGHADRVIQSVIGDDVQDFRYGTTGSDDTESGQHQIPGDERSAQFVTRSVGHPLLTGEDDQHVNADVVEADGPVRHKPHLGVRVLKLIFKLEDVRVVGHGNHFHAVDHHQLVLS